MLSDICRNNEIAILQNRIQSLQKFRSFLLAAILIICRPGCYLLPPVTEIFALASLRKLIQRHLHVTGNTYFRINIFIKLRRINVHMHKSFMRYIAAAFTSDPVIEATAKSKNEICLFDRIISFFVPMHSGHTQKQTAISAAGTQTHQRTYDGDLQFFSQVHRIIFCITVNYAAANEHYWPLGRIDGFDCFFNFTAIRFFRFNGHRLFSNIIQHCRLYITRNVNKNRARPASFSQGKSKPHSRRQLTWMFY